MNVDETSIEALPQLAQKRAKILTACPDYMYLTSAK